MGKKNKFKAGEAAGGGDKNPTQPQNPQQPAQERRPDSQPGTSGQQQRGQGQGVQQGRSQGDPQQQGVQQRAQEGQQRGASGGQQQPRSQSRDDTTKPQQGPWGGGQQQRGPEQQRGPGQQRGPEQQRGPGQQQQRGPDQQRGPGQQQQRGPEQQRGPGQQQQRGPEQQQRGPGQQRGASGGQQQSRSQSRDDTTKPQQGAWGGGQQQRGPEQQRGPGQQQQRGPDQQRGPGQQQQRGPEQQERGPGQQQQPWTGQRQQQRGPEQQRGPAQQRGAGDHGQRQQQRGPEQQRGPAQQRGAGDQGQQHLRQGMSQLSISEGNTGWGENEYSRLSSSQPNEAYHYDVTITPDRPKKFLRPAFEQCRREKFPDIESAFDGNKSCYTLKRLPSAIDHKVEIPDSSTRMKEFHVQIKETMDPVVDLNSLRTYQNESVSDKPMRALQVVEVVLASNNHDRGIRVGRSFFTKPKNPFDLEGGFEAWTGLFQAAILGEQPFLNVDIAHKSFPRKSTVIEYLRNQNIDIQQDIRGDRWAFRDVESFFKGIDIVYEPPPSFGATAKKYRVLEIGDPASSYTFKTDDGKQQTVAQYFQSRGGALKYPKLNCLKVGSTVRSIALPMEFCSIAEGQALNRKDGKKQVEKMIRFAATSTNVRKKKIMDLLDYFHDNDNPLIRAFGLHIGANFIKVPMRLLPAPFMEYLQGKKVTTSRGAWRMDGLKFLNCSKPPAGHKWAIIYEEAKCRRNTFHDLENFKQDVIKTSQMLNMNLANDAVILSYHDVNSKLKELLRDRYDLVFVVLSDRGTPYAKVKQNAELVVGILTQCIKEQTVFRTQRDRSVFSNILLKVNAKLNGTNHKIAQDTEINMKKLMEPIKNVMYLGADVTHPSPDQREIPSVVGSAASHDPYGACYNCQYRLQRSTVENIEDMESIMMHHLAVYHSYQKSYPSQIIYYRDGVSDGQFPIVKREELRAIKSACKKKGCNPKLTCVIVVKRHHTRFFPLKAPRDDRDFNNVEAGTVVDQHITHPNEVQFFMVSHQSIQGTAKPTRYNVIMDEGGFDINLLQMLTYNLCHMFPRCNRAVSYPAPAYLAHLVAFRGRVYLEGTFRFNKNLNIEYEKRIIKPEFMVKNPMYFV